MRDVTPKGFWDLVKQGIAIGIGLAAVYVVFKLTYKILEILVPIIIIIFLVRYIMKNFR